MSFFAFLIKILKFVLKNGLNLPKLTKTYTLISDSVGVCVCICMCIYVYMCV